MQAVAKWEIFEYTMTTERAFENAFLEVDLGAYFTKGDKKYTVDGFYDGEEDGKHVFRVRFSPMEEGIWNFETFANIPELSGQTGEFECTAAISKGGLTINPEYPNWFSREDGSPQMIINDGWFPHVGHEAVCKPLVEDDHQQPSEEDFKNFISLISEYGVNMMVDISQLYARNPEVFDTTFRWPWKVLDPKNHKFDKDRFNLDFYRRWERTLAFAKTKELFFDFELLYDDSVVRENDWAHHPVNKKNGGWLEGTIHNLGWDVIFDTTNEVHVEYTFRYLKYTLARLACFWNITWEVGAENGNLAMLNPDLLPWAKLPDKYVADWFMFCGDYIVEHDPYNRLRSLGDVNKQKYMVTSRHNNYIITQDPRNYPHNDMANFYRHMNKFGETHWEFKRPCVIGEMNQSISPHYDKERRLYWTAFVSGYLMGRSDRHFELMAGEKTYEARLFGYEKIAPIYFDLKIMRDFIENKKVRFWEMKPSDDLIRSDDLAFCLANEGKEYLVYFLYGGQVEMDLPDCEYEWLDPVTGMTFERTIWRPDTRGQLEAGTHVFKADTTEDRVLHIIAK